MHNPHHYRAAGRVLPGGSAHPREGVALRRTGGPSVPAARSTTECYPVGETEAVREVAVATTQEGPQYRVRAGGPVAGEKKSRRSRHRHQQIRRGSTPYRSERIPSDDTINEHGQVDVQVAGRRMRFKSIARTRWGRSQESGGGRPSGPP